MASIFKNVAVDIPNRSGFDMSHENLFTSKCGTLTPVFIDELLPNDKVDLSAVANIQLPPFASDFFGKLDLKMECFFVPFRLLYGGWKEFITIPLNLVGTTRPETTGGLPSSGAGNAHRISNVLLPRVQLTNVGTGGTEDFSTGKIDFARIGAGTLTDYLGCKVDSSAFSTNSIITVPAMPYLAYYKIYNDWYRDPKLTTEIFLKPNIGMSANQTTAVTFAYLPNTTLYNQSNVNSSTFANCSLNVSSNTFLDLKQRNFSKDYFTTASTQPQSGNAMAVSFSVSNNTGAFSIASLRAANSLQTWLERNNLAGFRYGDQIRANYGIYPADAVTDRCLYLGRMKVPVYAKSIFQSAPETSQAFQTSNPMGSVGANYGAPSGVNGGRLCNNFTASEHGYLFVMASLVPTAYYGTGTRRYWFHNVVTDFGWPLLQSTGDQVVYNAELADQVPLSSQSQTEFGYSQKYSEYKFMNSEIHGLMRDGESLSSFALQRSFDNTLAGTSSSFLEIPTNYLDQVLASSSATASFGYWCDSYFKYYKVSTLSAYSIPTLGDLKNVHKESIPLGGTRL